MLTKQSLFTGAESRCQRRDCRVALRAPRSDRPRQIKVATLAMTGMKLTSATDVGAGFKPAPARRYFGSILTVLAAFLVSLALLPAALAATTFGSAPGDVIVLVSPAAGSHLVAGQWVTLVWRPGTNFSRLDWVEEWEAFLSLDGGRHFALRITPHLDRALRTATWRVPDLPSNDVRFLLRFGDETRELLLPLSSRFTISRSTEVDRFVPGCWTSSEMAFAPGERARPGSSGVVAWSEGGREGGSTHWVTAVYWQDEVAAVKDAIAKELPPATVPEPVPSPISSLRATPRNPHAVSERKPLSGPEDSVRDLILLTERRIE